MKLRSIISVALLTVITSGVIFAQKCDPYHLNTEGFGYQISNDKKADLWWCEGAYKIMTNTAPPERKKKIIELKSAKNEYEAFQLIINPLDSIHGLNCIISDLKGPNGEISSSNIEIRKLEYVRVSKPSDSYGFKGLWPDPLPKFDGEENIYPGKNFCLWLTVYTPETAMAGIYKGKILLKSDNWSVEIPLSLTVWDFSLPRQTSIRSGFGLSVDKIAAYHNISSRDDLVKTFDLYMQSFRKYKIAPYNFYYLHQIKKQTLGKFWNGGYFDPIDKHTGAYSLRLEDNTVTKNTACFYTEFIDIDNSESYRLEWYAKSNNKDRYTILIESYDTNNQLITYSNILETFSSDTSWKKNDLSLKDFDRDVAKLKLTLFPTFRSITGESKGTVWFDDIKLISNNNEKENHLIQGGFEVNLDSLDIVLDFTDFDYAAKRYLDNFGFNSFRLNLEGMGSGTYYSREKGVFEGFKQGTPEYKRLMKQYLSQIQDHLKAYGWLGKEYIYWFDEPGEKDYPFVREGMELIKESAPEITTFLTENDPGPEIMDVTDITCTIWHRIKPDKVKKIRDAGQDYWSYLCTAPKSPWISEFIDHDAINLRMWLWMTYSYKLNGILIWSSNYWTSRAATLPGRLQNPWEEAASFVQGYGWPLGKQTNWGNGDGRFWYPPNKNPNEDKKTYIEGPVPSIRLEFLRQGIEDYEYLILLEDLIKTRLSESPSLQKKANKLLSLPESIFTDGKTYTKDPQVLISYRQKLAEMIIEIQNKTN